METTDYCAKLDELRSEIEKQETLNTEDALNLVREAMFTCIEVVEDNLKNCDRVWENAQLVREFLDYANHLNQFEHMVNVLYVAAKRMLDVVIEHPRLKLEIMHLLYEVLRFIENRDMHELGMTEDLREEMRLYQRNIEAADKGDFDAVEQTGHLKHDPIEWTSQWEEVIDEADEIVYKNLKGQPRGMGFCFAFWHERATVLSEKFGIEWRSPSLMNPGVIFD